MLAHRMMMTAVGFACAEGGSDIPLLALKRATAKHGALLDAEVAGAITGESMLIRRMPTGCTLSAHQHACYTCAIILAHPN